jgi:hypothetical protein
LQLEASVRTDRFSCVFFIVGPVHAAVEDVDGGQENHFSAVFAQAVRSRLVGGQLFPEVSPHRGDNHIRTDLPQQRQDICFQRKPYHIRGFFLPGGKTGSHHTQRFFLGQPPEYGGADGSARP